MRSGNRLVFQALLIAVVFCPSRESFAQFAQQGPKLVASGAIGTAAQGISVALSADGNTALVGGFGDNSDSGAAWVLKRSGNAWSQQPGGKLVGTGAIGAAWQGWSGSLSADGNTAMVGGRSDNSNAGAAWMFTQSGGVWSQQGPKLVGTGAVAIAAQGYSVSLSADGNTAAVGGPGDNRGAGAAWIFTRSGGVWTQQGSKLIGTDASGNASQGLSVSLSADGNTLISGGSNDSDGIGAAWIFTRTGGIWTQQGSKLVGTNGVGMVSQGCSVSISGDGNTAIVGGLGDGSGPIFVEGALVAPGAAWIFIRNGGGWSQQGPKLVGTGSLSFDAQQGTSVSLSADGNMALMGGPTADSYAGAAWIFTRSGGVWSQLGSKLEGTDRVGIVNAEGAAVALSADGSTAIMGGHADNANAGAVWIFSSLPDLIIANAHAGNTFTQGQQGAQYLLTVTNLGLAATTGTITVTDMLPAGLTFVSGSGGGFSCFPARQTVTCVNAATPIAASATASITLNVNVAGNAPASETTVASVACSCEESNTSNNTSNTDVVPVAGSADLSITETSNAGALALPNSAVTYSITVLNNGPGPANGVTVTDRLPGRMLPPDALPEAGVMLVSTTASQGSCGTSIDNGGTTIVTCSLGALANGASATISLGGITGASPGLVSNTATVTATTADPDGANNSSTMAFDIIRKRRRAG
jgi:uncharacterized repeat protein (TIGR01451 family)